MGGGGGVCDFGGKSDSSPKISSCDGGSLRRSSDSVSI